MPPELHATELNFSLIANQVKRGSSQLLWKRQETGKQVWKNNRCGGGRRGGCGVGGGGMK